MKGAVLKLGRVLPPETLQSSTSCLSRAHISPETPLCRLHARAAALARCSSPHSGGNAAHAARQIRLANVPAVPLLHRATIITSHVQLKVPEEDDLQLHRRRRGRLMETHAIV